MATFLQCMCPVPSHIFRRRKNAYPIVMGIVQSVNSVPNPPPPQVTLANTETLEYSLYVMSKESKPLIWLISCIPNPLMSSIIVYRKPLMWLWIHLGFKFDWSTVCTVTDVAAVGPATQILEPGDRIIKVSSPFFKFYSLCVWYKLSSSKILMQKKFF